MERHGYGADRRAGCDDRSLSTQTHCSLFSVFGSGSVPDFHGVPHSRPMIEALETRIAPAAVFTFTDVDGDLVTIKTSKGTNAELAAIITKMEVVPGTTPKEQLQKIDFSANAAVFAGTNLTITAKRTADGGDGLVNVGYVDAADSDGGTSLQLGVVKIAGDLGRIRVEAVVG